MIYKFESSTTQHSPLNIANTLSSNNHNSLNAFQTKTAFETLLYKPPQAKQQKLESQIAQKTQERTQTENTLPKDVKNNTIKDTPKDTQQNIQQNTQKDINKTPKQDKDTIQEKEQKNKPSQSPNDEHIKDTINSVEKERALTKKKLEFTFLGDSHASQEKTSLEVEKKDLAKETKDKEIEIGFSRTRKKHNGEILNSIKDNITKSSDKQQVAIAEQAKESAQGEI